VRESFSENTRRDLELPLQTNSIPRIDAPFVGISQRISSRSVVQLDYMVALGQHHVRCTHLYQEARANKSATKLNEY